MFNMFCSRALALFVVSSFFLGLGHALAQAPPYASQQPSTPAPGVGPAQPYPASPYPLTHAAPPVNAVPAYPRTATATAAFAPAVPNTPASSYPNTSYQNSAYPDTRTASRPDLYLDPQGGNLNAGVGNTGSMLNSEFNDAGAQHPGRDFSLTGDTLHLAGHVTKSSQGCDCDVQGRYDPGCATCTGQVYLFPEHLGGVQMGGWVQQGLTANFGDPNDRMNSPVLFNDRANDYQLNQLYLYAEKRIHNDGHQWELGGRLDVMLGTDARFLTVPGLEEHHDGTPKWNGETKQYGMAIPQAYLELAAPWLHGASLKAGHFYSIAGYETAAAPQNFFYSHAYTFLYGEPFTFTGALFTAKPNELLTVSAGYTKGWDVLESNSNEYGILASIKLTSPDQRTSLAATVSSGQDVTGVRVGGALIDEDRHFYSLVLQHRINDCLRYVFQHDFGYQEDGEVVVNTGPRTITFDEAKWYGINQYLIYDIDETLSTALRVEWFRDQDHSRVAVPVKFNPGGTTFLGGNYFALTGGVNWRPTSNIRVRPEVRWDYSDLTGNGAAPGGNPNVRAFDDARHSSQITAAFDVIVAY